jgi:membrane protein
MSIVTLAKNTFKEFSEDDCSTLAQALAYSAFFSLFPLLLAATAALGFFVSDFETRNKIMSSLYEYVPASGSFIGETLQGVEEKRGTATVISILLLIVSGRGVFVALVHALDVAFEVKQPRGFIGNILLAFALLFGVGFLMVLSLVVTAVIQALASMQILGFGPYEDSLILTPIQFVVSFAINLAMFALLFRWGPNVDLTWRDVLPGAVVAAFLFEVAKLGFVFYVRTFMDSESVYGAIGGVIVLLTWCYFASMILLLGAEVSSEYAKLRQAETAPAAVAPTAVAPRPGPVMLAPAQAPPFAQRALALASTIIASIAAFLAVRSSGRPSGQA